MSVGGIVPAFILAAAVPFIVFAQQRPDFSGTWTFNGALTPQDDRNGIVFTTLTITQTTETVRIEAAAFQQQFPSTVYSLSGAETVLDAPEGQTRTAAAWEGNRLVVTARRSFAGPQGTLYVDIRETYSLANGVLTLERSETPQGGKPIVGRFAFTGSGTSTGDVRRRVVVQTASPQATFSEGQGAGPRPPAAIPRTGAAADCPQDPVQFDACIRRKAAAFNPPRTPDGRPDLQGYWIATGGLTGISPTQAAEATSSSPLFGGGNSMIVDPSNGVIPYLPWALAERERRQRPENALLDPQVHCYSAGVPRQMSIMPFQFLWTTDTLLILHEVSHSYRIIHMNGRPHISSSFRSWQGDSIGRWDGKTLVVDTTNQNGMTYLDLAHNFLGPNLHVVERFMLADANLLYWTATLDDSRVFTRPWTMAAPMLRQTQKGYEIFESACHEENQDIEHITRALERIQ